VIAFFFLIEHYLIIFPELSASTFEKKDEADYSAVVLDSNDQVRLLELFPPSSDWVPCATHVTLNMGSLATTSGVQPGEKVEVRCIAVGRSSTNVAIKVEVYCCNHDLRYCFHNMYYLSSKHAPPTKFHTLLYRIADMPLRKTVMILPIGSL